MRTGSRTTLGLALVGLLPVMAGCSPSPPQGSLEMPPPEPITLTFETRTLERRSPGCDALPQSPAERPSAGCAEISLSWVELVDAPAGVARSAIHGWIEGQLLAPAVGEEAAASPEALAESFLAGFESSRAELSDSPGWSFERTLEPIHDDDQGVTFRLTESSYLGSAHPNAVTSYTTLYLTTGQPVVLEDLLVDGDPSRLQELAEAKLREVHRLGPDEDLGAAGFWRGERADLDDPAGRSGLPLGESFAVTDEGLLLHYNPYEIGPYAPGATTLTLPWTELDGVVAWSGHDSFASSGTPGAQSAL